MVKLGTSEVPSFTISKDNIGTEFKQPVTLKFKFRLLIDTHDCKHTHDILPPKGMCDVSRDFFKFWKNVIISR